MLSKERLFTVIYDSLLLFSLGSLTIVYVFSLLALKIIVSAFLIADKRMRMRMDSETPATEMMITMEYRTNKSANSLFSCFFVISQFRLL